MLYVELDHLRLVNCPVNNKGQRGILNVTSIAGLLDRNDVIVALPVTGTHIIVADTGTLYIINSL